MDKSSTAVKAVQLSRGQGTCPEAGTDQRRHFRAGRYFVRAPFDEIRRVTRRVRDHRGVGRKVPVTRDIARVNDAWYRDRLLIPRLLSAKGILHDIIGNGNSKRGSVGCCGSKVDAAEYARILYIFESF